MTQHSNIEAQARDYLSTLGLAFLIEGETIGPDAWKEICRLACSVLEGVTFAEPAEAGRWLRINSHCCAPDKLGWITSYQEVTAPYWIRRLDLSRLRELEDLLVQLRR